MINIMSTRKSYAKMKKEPWAITFMITVWAFCFIAFAPPVIADEREKAIPFAEADLFFELNNTDGDLGIHALIDGEPWKRLTIESPRERDLLNIFVQSRLRRQGLTEIAFESAEPTFDELAPKKFFRRFPQGEYEIEGVTLDRQELESVVVLTHLLPAPPQGILANDINLPEGCEDEPVSVVPDDQGQVTISWLPVTHSHPDQGITNEPIEVVKYIVAAEALELGMVFNIEVPPDVTQVSLPADFIALGEQFKLEILAKEESGNKTAVESCFAIVAP